MKRLALLLIILLLPGQAAAARILALSPHICEMLHAIGADGDVVGVAEYCDFPDRYTALPVVASHSHIFAEAAIRLKPDLAIVSNPSLKSLQLLHQQHIPILITHPETVSDIFADLLRLGEATGHLSEAAQLVTVLKQRLAGIKANNGKRQRLFFEVWSDPLMTEGGGSFLTEVLTAAGGDNVFADSRAETMKVNVEAVIRANPEVIVVPVRSGSIDDRIRFWAKWLPQARVVAVHPDLISRPGPRIIDGIAELQKRIAP